MGLRKQRKNTGTGEQGGGIASIWRSVYRCLLNVIDFLFLRFPRKTLLALGKKKVTSQLTEGYTFKLGLDYMVCSQAQKYLLLVFVSIYLVALTVTGIGCLLVEDEPTLLLIVVLSGGAGLGMLWYQAIDVTLRRGTDLAGVLLGNEEDSESEEETEWRWDAWQAWADAKSGMCQGMHCLVAEPYISDPLAERVRGETLGAHIISFLSFGRIEPKGSYWLDIQSRLDKVVRTGALEEAQEIIDRAKSDWERNAEVVSDLALIWACALCSVHIGENDLLEAIEFREERKASESRELSPLERLICDRGIEHMIDAYLSGVTAADIAA